MRSLTDPAHGSERDCSSLTERMARAWACLESRPSYSAWSTRRARLPGLGKRLDADRSRRNGIPGQTLHIDRARRLVIVINSATEQPTDRASGRARQEFIAAVQAELDAEKR